jgi:hypothetical protein
MMTMTVRQVAPAVSVQPSTNRSGRRPIYENAYTKKDEVRFANFFQAKYPRWNFQKAPISYAADWAMLDSETQQVKAFGEFKHRNYSWLELERWGGYNISLQKFERMRQWVKGYSLPVYLFLELKKEQGFSYYWLDLACVQSPKIVWWKVNRRGDWQDCEPAVQIPMSLFKELR